MELHSLSVHHLIHRVTALFSLVIWIPAGFVAIGGHFAEGNYTVSNNYNNTIPSRIINACNSHLFNIGNDSSGTLTLQSLNGPNPCSIFVSGAKDKSILFNFEHVDTSTFHYLFVERQDLLSRTCNRRFVAFTSNPANCTAIFSYNRLLLHLKGKITLQIQPFVNNNFSSQSCSSSTDCNSTCLQIPGTCNNTKVYHHITHCVILANNLLRLNHVRNVTTCQFYCPQHCTCSLCKHEVTTSCNDRPNIKTFVAYPDNLNGLHLGYKRINSLSADAFYGLDQLQELSLINNSLSEIPSGVFEHLHRMNWLDLSHNKVQSLSRGLFQDMTQLDSLNLGYNKIVKLEPGTFGEMRSLDALHLNDNNLITLNPGIFRGLPNLKWLDMASNDLIDLQPGVLDGLGFLQTLNVGDNNISQLQPNTFKGLNRLTVLNLHRNRLAELRPDSLGTLPGLSFLNLEGNNLRKIHPNTFQNIENLVSLTLSNNNLSVLEPGLFSHLRRLYWLHLDGNSITDLMPGTFRGLPFVQILLLQHNNITSLNPASFEGIPNLKQLNLSHNTIDDIQTGTFNDLINLERIFLNNNRLKLLQKGMFEGLINLDRLYLVQNQISEIEPGIFDGLSNLGILYLEGNKIKIIQRGVFTNISTLNIIQLTNNQLTHLSCDAFQDLFMLHYLNLENNSLQRLEENFCSNCNSLETLNIIGNALKLARISSFSGFTNSTQVLVDDHATCCFVETANCTAQNQKPVFLTCERLLPKQILRIFMWILGMCAICGNMFVLYTRLRQQRERMKVQSQLIIHLSFSDLLMGVYMILLTSADVYFGVYFPSHANAWRGGQTCQLASVLSVLSSEASVFFLTLISIDRMVGVKYPFSRFRLDLRTCRIVTSVLWGIAIALSTTPLLLSRLNPDIYDVSEVCIGLPLARKTVTASMNRSVLLSRFYTKRLQVEVSEKVTTEPGMYYSIAIFIGLNLLCFVVIAICYFLIFLTVKRSSRRVRRHRERDEEMRMALKMAFIVLTDFFCWMPVIITGILVQSGAIEISPVMYAWMVTFILPINSSINPFMYTIATIASDRLQKRKPLQRLGSVMNYSQDQRTIHKSSSSDESNSLHVKYKDIISSSQVRTNSTTRTSVSHTM